MGLGQRGSEKANTKPYPRYFSPIAESCGVSAQIGSGVVRGGHEVRFHQGSTRVPRGFHEGSTRFCEGCGVVRCCWGYHLSLFFFTHHGLL